MKQTQNTALDQLGLYPVDVNELDTWLTRHQRMHAQMNEVFGVQTTDLTILDLKDKDQADNWFFQHYLQHQGVASSCGMPI